MKKWLMKVRAVFGRVNGISTPFGGISWSAKQEKHPGQGGRGGAATVGGTGLAVGGPGGGGGPSGAGGDGGSAEVGGDGWAFGGEGGGADGRGGRSGYELAGLPNFQLPDGTWMYDIGRGGDGAGQVTSAPDPDPGLDGTPPPSL
ncbi:hypothetical protein GCM10009630_60220 [Kribbella jejuensis]